jgi:hypothetical protein
MCKMFHQILYTGGPRLSYIMNSHPLIRLSFSKFGLSYTADEKTFRAIAQWHCVGQTISSDFARSRKNSDVFSYSSVCSYNHVPA